VVTPVQYRRVPGEYSPVVLRALHALTVRSGSGEVLHRFHRVCETNQRIAFDIDQTGRYVAAACQVPLVNGTSLHSPTPQPLGCRAVGMPCHVGPLCFGATGASCPSQGSSGMLAFAPHAGGCMLLAACPSIGAHMFLQHWDERLHVACPLQSGRVLYYDLHAATAECVSAFETGSGNRRTTKVQSVNRARRGLRRRESNAAQRAGSRARSGCTTGCKINHRTEVGRSTCGQCRCAILQLRCRAFLLPIHLLRQIVCRV
jgi:hypothetical protein